MKRHIQKVLPRGRIGRSMLVLISGTAMAQAITAVSMPVVTRLYSPEMMGVISIYLSFFNFWLTLLTWRYESALLIAESDEESHHVFRLGAILAFGTALLAVPVMGGLKYLGVLGFDVLPVWAPLVAFLSLLGFGWFMLYRSWLLRLRDARIISISAISRSAANAGTRVVMGALGSGSCGLFVAEVLGSWAALGAVRKRTRQILGEDSPRWSAARILSAAKRYRKYAQYEMPSAVINQLALALPVVLVGTLYGAETAGFFGLAKLLYAIPNGQIGKAAGDVFQMELGKYVREKSIQRGERLFYKLATRLALIGIIMLLVAIYVAPPLVPVIFGSEWAEMGAIVARMAPWMFMALIVSSLSRALSVLQKQHLKLVYDSIALSVVIAVYYISKMHNLAILSYIDYMSAGMSSAYAIYFFLIAFSLRKAR